LEFHCGILHAYVKFDMLAHWGPRRPWNFEN